MNEKSKTTDFDELELYLEQAQREIGEVFNQDQNVTEQTTSSVGQGHYGKVTNSDALDRNETIYTNDGLVGQTHKNDGLVGQQKNYFELTGNKADCSLISETGKNDLSLGTSKEVTLPTNHIGGDSSNIIKPENDISAVSIIQKDDLNQDKSQRKLEDKASCSCVNNFTHQTMDCKTPITSSVLSQTNGDVVDFNGLSQQISVGANTSAPSPNTHSLGTNRCANTTNTGQPLVPSSCECGVSSCDCRATCDGTQAIAVGHGSFSLSENRGNVNEGHDLEYCRGTGGICTLVPHPHLSNLPSPHLCSEGNKCMCAKIKGSLSGQCLEKINSEINSRNRSDQEVSVSECMNSAPPGDVPSIQTHVNGRVPCVCTPDQSPVNTPATDICDEIDGFIAEIADSIDELLQGDSNCTDRENLCCIDQLNEEMDKSKMYFEEKEVSCNMKNSEEINHKSFTCGSGVFPSVKNNLTCKDPCTCENRNENLNKCISNEFKSQAEVSETPSIHRDVGVMCTEKGDRYVNKEISDTPISNDEMCISIGENAAIKMELTDFDDSSLTKAGVVETDLGYYWLTSTIEEKPQATVTLPDRSMEGSFEKDESLKECNSVSSEKLDDKVDSRCEGFTAENSVSSLKGNTQSMSQSQSFISNESRKSYPVANAKKIMSSFEPKFLSLDRKVLGKKRISQDDFQLKSVSDENLTVKPLRRKYSAPPSFCKVYKVISIDIPKLDSYVMKDKTNRNSSRRNSTDTLKNGSLKKRKESSNDNTTNQEEIVSVKDKGLDVQKDSMNVQKESMSDSKYSDMSSSGYLSNNDGGIVDTNVIENNAPEEKSDKSGDTISDSDKGLQDNQANTDAKLQDEAENSSGDLSNNDGGIGDTNVIEDKATEVKSVVLDTSSDSDKGLLDKQANTDAKLQDEAENRLEICDGLILEPPAEFDEGKKEPATNLNMQPTMVWDPGVGKVPSTNHSAPKVPPRTYATKLGHMDKLLAQAPPPPSPNTIEQLITNRLNGHVTKTDQPPPLPERRRIVNNGSVKLTEKKADKNVSVKSDGETFRKHHDIKGISRNNLREKPSTHRKMVHRLSGHQAAINALMEKRNTRDMLEVLESYKFVENFGLNDEKNKSDLIHQQTIKPNSKSSDSYRTDSLDRRKSKSNQKHQSAVREVKQVDSIYATVNKRNQSWTKTNTSVNTPVNTAKITVNETNVSVIKSIPTLTTTTANTTMEPKPIPENDNLMMKHMGRKLADKPQSYSEGMKHQYEHSPDFQVMVNSLSPVLLRRNSSKRNSVRKNAGSVETSPETTPNVSPRSNNDSVNNTTHTDTLTVPNKNHNLNKNHHLESLFIDPEMARTWHGATSLNWSKHYGPQMKAMMQELDSQVDREPGFMSNGYSEEDFNLEMGSKTLPSKSLLDTMHKKFCSDQYHNSLESELAREMVLLKLKSQPSVKPKRSQSFNIRMGTGKSASSLNSDASPLLHRVHKRIGIKTRPDFQYSPKPQRARETTPEGMSNIPVIKIPDTKREEAEIEAIESCRWLRETGFPQYAQLYEDGQFPVDIESVEKDHDFLDKEDIQSLFRRLNTLNKCAIMKIGTPAKKETEESDEEEQCALSDKWKYQRSSRRWSRKDLETPVIEYKNGQPVLRSASSHDSLLADQNSSSETGDSPVLDCKMHHVNDDMVLLKTSSPLDANGNATMHGSKVFQRAASEKIRGAKGLLKRMESLKVKRGRKPKTITEISEPVPTNKEDMQAKIKHLNCKAINNSADTSSHSVLSHKSTTDTSINTSVDTSPKVSDTSHNVTNDSILSGADNSANNSNSLVNGNESVRVTSPVNGEEDSSSTSTSATPSLSENFTEMSTSSNGALGLDLSPISRRSNSSETTNSSQETLFLPSEYKPGKFPTILDDSLFSTERSLRARSLSYNDEDSASPDLRHSRRGSHDPRKKLHRVSIYDNVPIEEDLQTAQQELDFILSELFQNINGLNKAINGENAELLEPPTFTSFDDTNLSIDSETPANEATTDQSTDFTLDENEVISGTLSSPDISDHEHTEDMSHDDSTEQIEGRERRDSGVGSSLTRTNSDRRKYRIRWHSFQKQHRPTSENRNLQISCVSAGQIMVLRKLSLLKLTALIEKYSPNRSGWSLSVPRFMKRHKVPDYKDKNVFGIPFTVMIQRTGQALPQCILHAMRFLRRTSSDAVGIFRKSGVRSRIQKLRNEIEANAELMEYEEQQSYDIADLVKQFFRELPECLLTNKLSDIFISIFIYVPVELRLEALQAAVILMADENRDVLQSLLLFLSDIAKHHQQHQMTASNLAVCFAPSLFNMGGLRHPTQTPSPRRTRKNAGIPDARELMEQKAAHECLTVMIQECKRLFTIPAATLAKCRLRNGDPVTLDQLNGGGVNDGNQGYTSYIDSCIQGLLKESREKFRGWVSVSVHNDVDVSYKKVGDGHPLRLWKCTVDIEAPPTEVLNRVLHDRQQWDEDLLQWHTVHKLDEETEVFQYVRNTMAPHPTRDFCVLRSWRSNLPKGACVLISTSIEHPDTELLGGIRAVELASRYLIEPCGAGKSRLTHISRVDMRGHSPEWYKKVYGHMCANFMEKIATSFKCKTEGPETKV